MRTTRYIILCTLIFACIDIPLKALEQSSNIQLRIHAPFANLYPGEKDYWLVRVENRGNEIIPVPDGSAGLTDESPPPQFHVQTQEAAYAGDRPQVSSWDKIWSFSNGTMPLLEKSQLKPGQAMEAFSWGLPVQLKSPPQSGKFRIAMQVGPDDFVYSNWITRIRESEPAPVMRSIHTGDPKGSGSLKSIGISENTDPPYLWYYSNKPAGRFAEPALYRICEAPKGMVPDVKLLDRDHGQYVISFPRGEPDAVYFAHRCGLSKSTPWPKGYQGKDFLLTSYPVSAPSPIGFPMALFQEDIQSIPNQGLKEINSADRPSKSNTVDVEAKVEEPADMDGPSLWIFAIPFFLLAGLIAFLISIRRNQKKQK